MAGEKTGEAPFEVEVDLDAGIVKTVLRGFWTMADLQAFGRAMLEAIGKVSRRHAKFALLSDSTGFKIQSLEVSEGFAAMMNAGVKMHWGPTAIVVGTMLNKKQAERVFDNPRVRIFTDSAAARRWIDADLAGQGE